MVKGIPTVEEIEARMREIEQRFENPPFTPQEGRAMLEEYMALEAMLAATRAVKEAWN